jgi:hypothetical protein
LTSGKTDASFLKQFGIRKLAPRRKLPADHPHEAQVGLDEPLPRQRPVVFQESQFLVCRIGETDTRYSRLSRQQARLDGTLQLDNLGVCQQGFGRDIVESLGHAPHSAAVATAGNTYSRQICGQPATIGARLIFSADAAGMQRLTACLEHHQLREHLVVFVRLLNWVRTLQPRLQCRDGTHHGQ